MKPARESQGAPSPDPALVAVCETVAIVPVFCDGLHTVEVDRHGIARLALYAEQRDAHDGRPERVLAARLILPAAVLASIAARIIAASQAAVSPPEQRRPLN